jgi:AcrR family transcriptional regulator
MKNLFADRRSSTSKATNVRPKGKDASTKERVLEVAEKLFIDEGFSESSMRRITAEAGASLGAINYHFGSKEGLLEAVVERRFGPLLIERMSGLQVIGTATQSGAADLILQLLESWLDPMLRHLAANPQHVKILYAMDQLLSTQSQSILRAISPYQAYLIQFGKALQFARPDLSQATAYWRFHFLIGSATLALSSSDFILAASEGLCVAEDLQNFRREFLAAAMLMFGIPEDEAMRAISLGDDFPN